MELYKKLEELIDESNKIVVISGAGISTLSGIKDFKSIDEDLDLVGLTRVDVLSKDYFNNNYDDFWNYYIKYFDLGVEFKPNKIHQWIYNLSQIKDVNIITQNIDGLHQKSGIDDSKIIEIHGNGSEFVNLENDSILNLDSALTNYKRNKIKPNIVLFGEDIRGYDNALKLVKETDLLLVIGTRLEVYPVCNLVDKFIKEKKKDNKYRRKFNKKLVIWNKDDTSYDIHANLVIHEDFRDYFK